MAIVNSLSSEADQNNKSEPGLLVICEIPCYLIQLCYCQFIIQGTINISATSNTKCMRSSYNRVGKCRTLHLLLLLCLTVYIAKLPIEVNGQYRENRKLVMDSLVKKARKLKDMVGIDLVNHVSDLYSIASTALYRKSATLYSGIAPSGGNNVASIAYIFP